VNDYDGRGLTPLFYSEISSSYMLYYIFETHPEIVVQLIEARFQIAPEQTRIQRSIDVHDISTRSALFLPFLEEHPLLARFRGDWLCPITVQRQIDQVEDFSCRAV
jgi:hypothetical protein